MLVLSSVSAEQTQRPLNSEASTAVLIWCHLLMITARCGRHGYNDMSGGLFSTDPSGDRFAL